ncbi:phosphoribosylanthranilate isomerase [Alloscardovia omnicolens]|uniref:phosphoribosylanthranilate isomerase n=1 Tax=Alloscardovia omnicolens TaxID=419015 RepID=UPI003A7856E6
MSALETQHTMHVMHAMHAQPRVKLCGLRRMDDIAMANELNPDYVGFVFAEQSRRAISVQQAIELKKALKPTVTVVGVFVDEPIDHVAQLLDSGVIDMAQLHGDEDESYIDQLRSVSAQPIIQALKIRSANDIAVANASNADYVLLDSGAGTGEVFDWSVIRDITRPYFLAGGLNPTNVGHAVRALHPWAVDVSSGIETQGIKDFKKAAAFMAAVRGE